jgi:cytochrome c556
MQRIALAVLVVASLAGCARRAAPPPNVATPGVAMPGVATPGVATPGVATPFAPSASIQELMQSIVDPSADAMWDSVSTDVDAAGTHEHRPTTPEEWQAVRRYAVALSEAANLLVQPRAVAHGGGKLEDAHVEGINDAKQVRAAIDADPAAFALHAQALHAAARAAVDAIDAHDAKRLLSAGERVDAACESCHSRYWYPNDFKPTWPAKLGKN